MTPRPPPTAYDTMQRLFAGIEVVARHAAERWRAGGTFREGRLLPHEALLGDDEVQEFLHAVGRHTYRQSGNEQAADDDMQLAGQHLYAYISYELYRRKTFWVDPPLGDMLGNTTLDIEGEVLKLPFPVCAFVFNDEAMLGAANALLATDGKRAGVKVVTAYAMQPPDDGGPRPLHVNLLLDRLDDDWPYLFARDLLVDGRSRLDDFLDSHFAAPDVSRDPIFRSPEMKRVVHLVVNAVLYATSAGVEPEVIPSSLGTLGGKGRRQRAVQRERERLLKRTTAEEVFFLPGKIDIRTVRQIREAQAHADGGQILARFMVRGHWRRAAATWKDQRPRWIEPFWKGPDLGVVIEKEYRLKP